MLYAFDNYLLDEERRELRRGPAVVPIEPGVFDLLLCLIRNRDRVVSKDDLLAAVWNGRIVSESTLSGRINAARCALGDSGEQQRLIRTFPRKGYRFVGEIRAAQSPVDEHPQSPAVPVRMGPLAARLDEHQRRQLTIMACEIVGLATLSAGLDPEDLREVVAAYHGCIRVVVERQNGFVAKFLPEGALVCFGYPQANEDDAERAVRAGLAATRMIGELRVPCLESRLQARAGIATGLVVIGSITDGGAPSEHMVIGDTPLIANRLVTLADPGAVVLSTATRRLVGKLFKCIDLDAADLQHDKLAGASQVLRENPIGSRFEALRDYSRTPLLGREEELDLLMRRWTQAKVGEGRVVHITGEPGIGKSRLAQALVDCLVGSRHTQIQCHCSPYHADTPLHPVISHLLRAAGIENDDGGEKRLDKLEVLFRSSRSGLPDTMPLLAPLLSIPLGERYPPLDLSPQRRKERTLTALIDQLVELAAHQPVLMVFEDAHWIDPTSLELLSLTIERVARLPILLIITARPEFSPPWPMHRHISVMALGRLGQREGMALVHRIAKDKALPSEVLNEIIDHTDGVPLFIEELTKTVLECGILQESDDCYVLSGPMPPLAIPSTLHASLLARLDRLASVKDVAQIGAAIGRQFSYGLIAAVSGIPEHELAAALAKLVAAELIFQRGLPPDASYVFKHALVQDAAYATLIRTHRQQLHKDIVRALKEHFPETEQFEPQLLAKHCDQAALAAEASRYWLKAGRLAMTNSSTKEARLQLEQGLRSARRMHNTVDRRRLEFDLYAALGQVVMATEGYASSTVGGTFGSAEKLAREMDDRPRLHSSLVGLRTFHQVRGELKTAKSYGFQCTELASQLNDATLLVQSQICLAHTLCYLGEFSASRLYLAEAAPELEALANDEKSYSAIGLHPKVWSPALASWTEWHLGYPDKATDCAHKAIEAAQRLGRAQVIEHALYTAAQTNLMRREPKRAIKLAVEASTIAQERGYRMRVAINKCVIGGAYSLLGRASEGVAQILEGMAEYDASGARAHQTMFLALLADALGKVRRFDEGLETVARGVSMAQQTAEQWWGAELYRIEGDLIRAGVAHGAESAEQSYLRSLEIAKKQRAKSWELRTANSLASLWKEMGCHAEAHDLLSPVYNWFTEGFDLPDLRYARTLLT